MVRAWIYDRLRAESSRQGYRKIFSQLPNRARILDVGVGTGCGITHNSDLILTRQLRVVGLDIDQDYLDSCVRALSRHGLTEWVSVIREPVLHHRGGPYDAVTFCSSFMLMQSERTALQHVLDQLKPDGRIYFLQTFHLHPSPIMERVKPLLHFVTTIQFGKVTYEKDFTSMLTEAGLEMEKIEVVMKNRSFEFRLVTARVVSQVTSKVRVQQKSGITSIY